MERGTAARNVPVRQTRVAERDDDVAVSSSDLNIERNETWCVGPTKRGPNITRAETQLGVASRIDFETFSKESVERKKGFETAASEMAHVFSGDRRQNRTHEKGSRARASHLGNLISDCSARVSFTGASSKPISTLLSAEHPDSKESGHVRRSQNRDRKISETKKAKQPR
jgi:hypothetical protein